jgi:hypothetical protein
MGRSLMRRHDVENNISVPILYSFTSTEHDDMDVKRFEKINIPYENLPMYRKRWFIFLTLIIFLPATILIALTGDIYAKKDESVYKFKDNAITHLIIMATVFIAVGLFLMGG